MQIESITARNLCTRTHLLACWASVLSLVVLGFWAETQAETPCSIASPAVMRPDAGTCDSAHLPVELLGPLNRLDLSEPAKVELPRLEIPKQTRVEEPVLSMPALVAPQVDSPRVASRPQLEAPAKTELGAKDFAPEWRSPRRSTPGASSDDQPAPLPNSVRPQTTESDRQVEPSVEQPEPITKEPAREPTVEAAEPTTEAARSTGSTKSAAQTAEPVAKPVRQLKPLTRNQIYLRNKLRTVLSHYYRQPLNTRDHDSWEMMHNMLAFELHSRLRVGGPRGKSVTSVGWLCYNNACKGKQLLKLTDEGLPHGVYGVGMEGHSGQFLSMLAQCNVDPDYPVRVGGQEFTIHDLIRAEQRSCHANSELSFKLISLMHYLPSDTTWVNDHGEAWSMERLVREELNQPIRGVACGGSHRLNGLSLAVKKREERGEPVEGVWLEAKQFTDKYEQYCYRLQNSDGSFSTEWFRGPGRERDIDRRCRTTGHLTEWILYHVEDEQLTSYRVVKAVSYLTNLLYTNSDHEWEIGSVSHALHALTVYNKRMFKPYDEQAQQAQAARAGQSTRSRASSSTSRQTSRSRQR